MKLNLANKSYITIAILLFLAIIYSFIHNRNWDRYNYSASITAPATFPIHLKEAYFLLDNDDFESVGGEEVDSFTSNWNDYYDKVNHAENQLLPSKLVLNYVSYRDEKFYRDTLNLPFKEMKMIFESASKNKQFLVLSSYAGTKKGLAYMVGVANDGNIIVWLRGVNLERVILKTELKVKEPLSDDLYYEKLLSKRDYINTVFANLTDSVKTLLKSGYDSKANYIDTPSRYIENNKELWEYQKKNGFID